MNEEEYQEQGMTFSDFFFLLKRNILMILIITIACTVLGIVYAYAIKKPVYTATATAVVQAEQATTNNQESTSFSYSVALANTFKYLMESEAVIKEAAIELAKEDKYVDLENAKAVIRSKLKNGITVSSPDATLIINISAKSGDKEEAILLANIILKQTIKCADQIEEDDEGAVITDSKGEKVYVYKILANKLKVLQLADNDTTSLKHNEMVIVVVSFVIGLVISLAIDLIKNLTDDTFTSKDAFEKAFKINIIAAIQDAAGGNE